MSELAWDIKMHEWITLTTHLGESVRNPSHQQLRDALSKVFAAKDSEHPDSWIECGSSNGPLYVISIFSSGYALYTKYSDADVSDEIESYRL